MEKAAFQPSITLQQQQIIRKVDLSTIPQAAVHNREVEEVTSIECRICLQSNDDQNSELISPCNCTGSVKYIHASCFKSWISKKYQDPIIRQQITSNIGLKCQICKEKYQYSYSIQNKCTNSTMFCMKMKNNKLFLVGNLVFIIVDIILLAVASNFASNDSQETEFDIKQPRYFLTFIAIIFAAGSLIYGFYEFISFFLTQEKFLIFPLNKISRQFNLKKIKSQECRASQRGRQQQTNLRIVEHLCVVANR